MTSPLRRGHVASLCLTLVGVPSGRRNGVFVWYRTVAARSATDRLRLPAHVYGTAFPRRFVTYHWQFTLLANILTHFFSSWARPRRICDIYDFFAPYTNVLTYLLTCILYRFSLFKMSVSCMIQVRKKNMRRHPKVIYNNHARCFACVSVCRDKGFSVPRWQLSSYWSCSFCSQQFMHFIQVR